MKNEEQNSNEPQKPQLNIGDVSGSAYDKAIKYAQQSYVNDSKGLPAMLLGDVAELIKITTGKEVDWNILEHYR